MALIFGKRRPNHSWCPTLTQWVDDTANSYHAIGANIECDNRVTKSRMSRIEREIGSASLEAGIAVYFKKRVEAAPTPEFADPSLSENRVSSAKISELAWVLDLTGLYTLDGFVDAVEKRMGGIPDKSYDKTDPSVAPAFFDAKLGNIRAPLRPTLRQRAYVRGILAELADRPRHPIWATPYAQIEPHLASGPERWLEVVGVPKSEPGRYIAVIKYACDDIALFRPCVADAATSAFHYPTPAELPPEEGGRCMDLADSHQVTPSDPQRGTESEPLCEYIHSHQNMQNGKLVAIGKTKRRIGIGNIVEYRKRHRLTLVNMWPELSRSISQWKD